MVGTALSIELQMSLLLFVALAGYLISLKINQSAVVGVLVMGIIIGPSVLNVITYTDFVKSLAHLGAVVLLFVIGLEFKLQDILNKKYAWIAFLGVLVPWVSGFLLAKLFGFPSNSAIFIGTALTATSIAITANVLREAGKLQTDLAKAIIGAAIIDDVLGLVLLSMSVGISEGTFSAIGLALIILKAIVFVVVGVAAGHFIANEVLVKKIDESKLAKRYPEFVFLSAMALAFFYASIAELIGLSAITGAFIAGVCLEGINLRNSKSFKEGAEYVQMIFGAMFFLALGVLVDFKILDWPTVIFLVVLTIVAISSKIIGCGIAAKMSGLSTKDSLIIGVGMMPRGEVAMIVALIGLNQNIIDQKIYVCIVLMSILTTLVAPIVLRKLMNVKYEVNSQLKWKTDKGKIR